jgi:ABC-type transport system substrate-binding protein
LDLNDLGIRTHVKTLSQEELSSRYLGNNQFQAVLTEFKAEHRIPEAIAATWTPMLSYSSLAGGFEDKEVTRLARLIASEDDLEKRKALCHQIDARIAFLQPGSFLYHKTIIDVMSNRISIPFPFSLTQAGAYRLWRATIK